MPLNLFYTMVQKSQKWPKTQIKGGSCLNKWTNNVQWALFCVQHYDICVSAACWLIAWGAVSVLCTAFWTIDMTGVYAYLCEARCVWRHNCPEPPLRSFSVCLCVCLSLSLSLSLSPAIDRHGCECSFKPMVVPHIISRISSSKCP